MSSDTLRGGAPEARSGGGQPPDKQGRGTALPARPAQPEPRAAGTFSASSAVPHTPPSRPAADQAAALRTAARQAAAASLPTLPAIAVTGGKGGVGKTCVAVNLAVQLGLLGLRPLLVDCDLGLANADALLGVNPTRTLAEVILANADPTSAVIDTPAGIPLLPAASGVDELTGLNPTRLRGLVAELGRLARNYDLLVLDTAAGIGSEVTLLVAAARLVLVVITPEPTSLTDAYALIKLVESRHPGRDFRIVVNQAESPDEAARTFGRLQTVAKGFLGRDLGYLGHLPRDLDVRASIRRRRPFALTSGSPAGQALRSVAIRLKGEGWVRSG